MRIQRPKLIRGNIQRQVAIGEKIVVRRWEVYKLPPTPTWVNESGKLNWLEKLVDGLIHQGWFKNSDIYLRIDPAEAPADQPITFVSPSCRGEKALVLSGSRIEDLLDDAQLYPHFKNGALFVKTSP